MQRISLSNCSQFLLRSGFDQQCLSFGHQHPCLVEDLSAHPVFAAFLPGNPGCAYNITGNEDRCFVSCLERSCVERNGPIEPMQVGAHPRKLIKNAGQDSSVSGLWMSVDAGLGKMK